MLQKSNNLRMYELYISVIQISKDKVIFLEGGVSYHKISNTIFPKYKLVPV